MLGKRPIKGAAHPKEMFALGSKGKQESEVKSAMSGLKKAGGSAGVGSSGSSHVLGGAMKRDRDLMSSINSGAPPPKKPRTGAGFSSYTLVSNITERRGSPSILLFENIALDVDGFSLVEAVTSSLGDPERVDGLLCGAVKSLKSNRSKPDSNMCLGLMFLAKSKPSIFQSDVVIEAFYSLLKRDLPASQKMKPNGTVCVLACNVLMTAMQDEDAWPDHFVKAYLDDSLGERMWVDRIECRCFVENIFTAFNTKLPKTNLFQIDPVSKIDSASGVADAEDATSSALLESVTGIVKDRYKYSQSAIEPYVVEVLRDQLSRRQPLDGGSKNLVRTMTVICGFSEVRILAAQRLDLWLQSPKLSRVAQDLLMSVCMNCNPRNYSPDLELITNLLRIRFKTKPLANYFSLCLKELLGESGENIPVLLQHVVNNELSTMRGHHNMTFIAVMLQQSTEQTTRLLAEICLEYLTVREDHTKSLRLLIREIVKNVKLEFNFGQFVYSLLQERNSLKFRELDSLIKERYMMSVVDLVTMIMLLCVTNSVREASTSAARLDVKEIEVLRSFQKQITFLQSDVVWWLHSVVVKMMTVKPADFMHCLRKVFFAEKPDQYSKIDNWPPESDRGFMLKLVSEVPIMENTLLRIVLMGLNKELHLSTPELIDLLEVVVKKAACLYSEDFPVLKVYNDEFIETILNLCAYRHPENTVLPEGYKPPMLAITSFYWKVWTILLIVSSFNPASVGLNAWNYYPTLKCLMEMCMTNNFTFPPVTMAIDENSAEEIKSQERQMAEYVKQQTLEFECHLAGSVINESNSRLLSQVSRMEPKGFILKPPQSVLDSLKLLNQSLSLGKLLCQSRGEADFLLNIINRQGTSQSMPWLKDLVESNDSSLEILPVQCLCEFLLQDVQDDDRNAHLLPDVDKKQQQKNAKQKQLLIRLQSLVRSTSNDEKVIGLILQTLSYFFERLGSHQRFSRKQATKCLALVLGKTNEDDTDAEMDCGRSNSDNCLREYKWLISGLPSLHHFEAIKEKAFTCLRKACQVETAVSAVSAYVVFLSQHSSNLKLQELDELVLDMGQLIVERVSLINCLLPQEESDRDPKANLVLTCLIRLFYCYLTQALQPQDKGFSWSNHQDLIRLQWSSGQSAKMNILVVHAMVILLTYGPPNGESRFNELLDAWFPIPDAFLMDTQEEALLLPEWLKLRMIRSNVERLVDASFDDVVPSQLLLFVQSFGIPVHSMERLLQLLDEAVVRDSAGIQKLIVDKSYMSQLIEVQHMRGASGGDRFYQLLNTEQPQVQSPQCRRDNDLMDFMVDDVNRPKPDPSLQVGLTSEDLASALRKIFLDDGIPRSDKHKILCNLQKVVSKEPGKGAFVESCTRMIESSPATGSCGGGLPFVQSLLNNSNFSSPLFRLALANTQSQESRHLCNLILKHQTNPSQIFVKMLVSHRKKFDESLTLPGVQEKMEVVEEVKAEPVEHEGENIQKMFKNIWEKPSQMEESVSSVLVPFIKQEVNSAEVLEALYQLLDSSRNRLDTSLTSGFILDCIEVFNPQIVHPNLIKELLGIVFKKARPLPSTPKVHAKLSSGDDDDVIMEGDDFVVPLKNKSSGRTGASGSECFLSLLIHRSGWSNLKLVVNHLLKSPSGTENNYDHSIVLDFIEACFKIPSLHQGRDKKICKHRPTEDIMSLSTNQLQTLVSLVVADLNSSTGDDPFSSSKKNKLNRRLDLIENCCSNKRKKLSVVVAKLSSMQKEMKRFSVSNLLWGMYLRSPHVFTNIPVELCSSSQSVKLFFTDPSHMDILSHRMVVCLMDVPVQKTRLNDDGLSPAAMVSKKLASLHPLIFLRQLPLLSSFLNGQAIFTSTEAKSHNLAVLISNVLGIIRLLQPYIFHSVHSLYFNEIVDSLAKVISVHGNTRHFNSLVRQILDLLFNYLSYSYDQAFLCLQKYIPLLGKINRQFKNCDVAGAILTRLTLPCQSTTTSSLMQEIKRGRKTVLPLATDDSEMTGDVTTEKNSKNPDLFSFQFGTLKSQTPSLKFKPLISSDHSKLVTLMKKTNRLSVSSVEELMDGIMELEDLSREQIDILEQFTDNIKKLMLDSKSECRNYGHSLMMRLLRFNPRYGKLFYPGLKKCLENKNLDVVNAALEVVKEFTILAQENAREVLQSVFVAGITWNIDTTPIICETLQVLNLTNF